MQNKQVCGQGCGGLNAQGRMNLGGMGRTELHVEDRAACRGQSCMHADDVVEEWECSNFFKFFFHLFLVKVQNITLSDQNRNMHIYYKKIFQS